MERFEVFEKLTRRADLTLFQVLQTLTNTFFRVGSGGNVKQALIGAGVLDDSRGLTLHSEHQGALGSFELFYEIAGTAAERRQRLNVLRDIEHDVIAIQAPF
jgi:hypothetical protein